MIQAIKERVTIKPGGKVELHHPELREGAVVDVIVLVDSPVPAPAPLTSFIGAGKGMYGTQEEADAYLRQERDSWES